MNKFYYGGVLLPEIPKEITDTYPYIWISNRLTSTSPYDLVASPNLFYYSEDNNCFMVESCTYKRYKCMQSSGYSKWEYSLSYTNNGSLDKISFPLIWCSVTINKNSIDSGDVYLLESEPRPERKFILEYDGAYHKTDGTKIETESSGTADNLQGSNGVLGENEVYSIKASVKPSSSSSDQTAHVYKTSGAENSFDDLDDSSKWTKRVTWGWSNVSQFPVSLVFSFEGGADNLESFEALMANNTDNDKGEQRTYDYTYSISYSDGSADSSNTKASANGAYRNAAGEKINYTDDNLITITCDSSKTVSSITIIFSRAYAGTVQKAYVCMWGVWTVSKAPDNLLGVSPELPELTAEFFRTNGSEELPTGELLKALDDPKIYMWEGGSNDIKMTASVKGTVANEQELLFTINTSPMACGIRSTGAEYSGKVNVAFEDQGTWSAAKDLGEVVRDGASFWAVLKRNPALNTKIILVDKDAWFKSLKFMYEMKNAENSVYPDTWQVGEWYPGNGEITGEAKNTLLTALFDVEQYIGRSCVIVIKSSKDGVFNRQRIGQTDTYPAIGTTYTSITATSDSYETEKYYIYNFQITNKYVLAYVSNTGSDPSVMTCKLVIL